MKRLPKIGQRVRFVHQSEWDKEPRVCEGIVTKFYRTYDYQFDDNDEPILGTERLRPVHEWHAAVKVDRPLPKWWAYGEQQDVFAPCVEDLQHVKQPAENARAA